MEENVIHIPSEDIEIIDVSEYSEDLTEYFSDMPEVARPLVKGAKKAFSKIEQMLYDCFPEDTVSFAKALLLGDTTDLTYEVDTALKISGIRHVVAVSGLHVAILFALIQMIALKNPVLTALLGFPVLLAFAALAGFTPSVSRACMMCGLMIFGRLIDKEYDGLTALSFAVLVMLIFNPWGILTAFFGLVLVIFGLKTLNF